MATVGPRSSHFSMSRRCLLAGVMAGAVLPVGRLSAESSDVIGLPRPVYYDGATQAFLAWGHTSFARDLIHSPGYGGSETFLVRSDGIGKPAGRDELQAGRRLEARAGQVAGAGKDAAGVLLELVHREHRRNLASPPAMAARGRAEVLANLAARATACGDVALALSILLNRAGCRTRVLLVAATAEHLGRADHVTMEVFVPNLGRWVLLEGLPGLGVVPGGVSPQPAAGMLDLLADAAAMAALNAAHGHPYYTDMTCFATILPDPDYTRPLEVLWVPTADGARRFLAHRFGMTLGG